MIQGGYGLPSWPNTRREPLNAAADQVNDSSPFTRTSIGANIAFNMIWRGRYHMSTDHQHLRSKPTPNGNHRQAIAGTAAQAIYFALDSGRSIGTGWKIWSAGFYQDMSSADPRHLQCFHVYLWRETQRGSQLLTLLKTELMISRRV
jgi:hypothetical protein